MIGRTSNWLSVFSLFPFLVSAGCTTASPSTQLSAPATPNLLRLDIEKIRAEGGRENQSALFDSHVSGRYFNKKNQVWYENQTSSIKADDAKKASLLCIQFLKSEGAGEYKILSLRRQGDLIVAIVEPVPESGVGHFGSINTVWIAASRMKIVALSFEN